MPTLLLVEDNAVVQRMVAMTLAAEDIAVSVVSDGDEAIKRIPAERPDIVLAAISAPRRSGYDIAAFVKSAPDLASIPVVLLTGAFEPVDQVRAAQVRCDGVLVKPLEPQQVVARVRELLTTRRPAVSQPRVAGEQSRTAPAQSTDEFFQQLDAAFAQRAAAPRRVVSDDAGVVPTLEAVLQTPDVAPGVASPPVAIPPSQPAPLVTDALVDEVTRRVVERLGTAALRDVVADVVADTAERLIREEIARIRRPKA